MWSLGRCLDERDFGGLRELFTADATVTGRANLLTSTRTWSLNQQQD